MGGCVSFGENFFRSFAFLFFASAFGGKQKQLRTDPFCNLVVLHTCIRFY